MRHSQEPSRNLPIQNPRDPEAAFLEIIAALAEKRSSLLHEEAKLWSQASLVFAEFASSAASMNFARNAVPVSRDGERSHILNVTEAAKFLRLSPGTLNGWRLTGGGPEFVRLGRRIFYRADVLERFVQEKSYPHTSAYGHEK